MDRSHGTLDESVLNAGSTVISPPPYHPSPHLHSLLNFRPTISAGNMQLSYAPTGAIFDRIKCEEMVSDSTGMLSRTAAVQLCEKSRASVAADAMRHPAFGIEFRGLRSSAVAPMPSYVPAYDVMDFVTASNSFNFLMAPVDTSALKGSSANTVSSSTHGLASQQHVHDQAGHVDTKLSHANPMMVTSSLLGFPKGHMGRQALESNQSLPNRNLGPPAEDKVGMLGSQCLINSKPHPSVPPDPYHSPDILTQCSDSPNSPNSPSKQDSALSAEDLDSAEWRKAPIQNSCKRRKTQQKRIVYVPTGDVKQLKGETPPSDTWAWRKYGQKPIKGSPYPRGYYRCSSSKGCPARKQVERSCTDPTMLIVTYTSDHNHVLPVSKTNFATAAVTQSVNVPSLPPQPLVTVEKSTPEDQSEEAATTSSCEVVNESLFSSIVNSVNSVDEQVVSSLDVPRKESFSMKRDVDLCFSSTRTSTTEEDGVFDDLGELPESSSIFSRGYLEHVDGWFSW